MNDEAIVIQLLLQNSPIWVAFMLGFVPTLVAGVKQRPKTRWYLYGLLCALTAGSSLKTASTRRRATRATTRVPGSTAALTQPAGRALLTMGGTVLTGVPWRVCPLTHKPRWSPRRAVHAVIETGRSQIQPASELDSNPLELLNPVQGFLDVPCAGTQASNSLGCSLSVKV